MDYLFRLTDKFHAYRSLRQGQKIYGLVDWVEDDIYVDLTDAELRLLFEKRFKSSTIVKYCDSVIPFDSGQTIDIAPGKYFWSNRAVKFKTAQQFKDYFKMSDEELY